MKIHNLMEEYVSNHVNKLYDEFERERPVWLRCSCGDCRMDVTSYVLNRVPPRYVVSGRGVVHSESVLSDAQLRADVDTLTLEGIRLINALSRPYHKVQRSMSQETTDEPSFNFPVFMGNVLDGSTFEPVSNACVTLKMDDENAIMLDKTWSNPCTTCQATKGVYSFWVRPMPAAQVDEAQKFVFTIMIKAEDYSPATYSFDLTIVSEKCRNMEMDSSFSLKIQDMFLFRLDASESLNSALDY